MNECLYYGGMLLLVAGVLAQVQLNFGPGGEHAEWYRAAVYWLVNWEPPVLRGLRSGLSVMLAPVRYWLDPAGCKLVVVFNCLQL